MARKYRIHRYYSVIVWTTKQGKIVYDDLTLREARSLYYAIQLNSSTYYKEIVRRLFAEHNTIGRIPLEEI